MKKIFTLFTLTFIMGWMGSSLHAQDDNLRRAALRFGINFGGSWQTSDVRWIGGSGVGATLEVPIIENETSLLGISLRGRYLWTATFGRDYTRSTGVLNNNALAGKFKQSQYVVIMYWSCSLLHKPHCYSTVFNWLMFHRLTF